ncbi:MAG: DUF2934 domain-containing protein [Pseudorhizobium sp.]
MADDKEEQIRRRAYALWEEGGRPADKDAEHWEQATRELDQAAAAGSSSRSSKTAEAKTVEQGKTVSTEPAIAVAGKKSGGKKTEVNKTAVTKRTSKPKAGS